MRGSDAKAAIPYLLDLARRAGPVRNLAYLALYAIDPAAVDEIESSDATDKAKSLDRPNSKIIQKKR